MTHDWWPVDRFRGTLRFMTGAQPVARGHRSHVLVDQFVIYTPNGWGTAVVGVNEGTAGGIRMPSANSLLFLWADGPRCLISETSCQLWRCTWAIAELLVNSRRVQSNLMSSLAQFTFTEQETFVLQKVHRKVWAQPGTFIHLSPAFHLPFVIHYPSNCYPPLAQ